MTTQRDVEEGWEATFPGIRQNGYQAVDIVELGPEVYTVLQDRVKTTTNPTTLTVEYSANNPVTITWKVGRRVLCRVEDRVRQSETSLRLSRRWFEQHLNSRYTVTVEDQVLGHRYSVNPMSTSCKIIIED